MRNRHYLAETRSAVLLAGMCAMFACAASAWAADGETEVDALSQALRERQASQAELLAGVWVPRLGGESRFDTGFGSSQIVFETELNIDDIEATPNVELTLRRNSMALHMSGFDFSTSTDGSFNVRPTGTGPQQFGSLTLSDGDPIRADFDFTSAAVELQFLNIGPLNEKLMDDPDVTVSVSPTIGARWVRVEQSISTVTDSDEADGAWLSLLVGLSTQTQWTLAPDVPIVDSVSFDFTVAIGPAIGGDGGYIWHVRAGIHLGITPRFGVLFGYRLVELNLEGDKYDIDGGLQGLFVAGSLRF